jgi:hypothetical protein
MKLPPKAIEQTKSPPAERFVSVTRAGDGWILSVIVVRGSDVTERMVKHGPDVRRVCMVKALRELETE